MSDEGIGAATGIMSDQGIGDPIDGVLYDVPVNVRNVTILSNPAPFLHPIEFNITFECLSCVEHGLEWSVIYVGGYDQLLECIDFEGPIPAGTYEFILEARPPEPSQISVDYLRGPSVITLKCSYLKQVFYHRGHFLNNEYDDEKLIEDPPEHVIVNLLQRNILTDHAVIKTSPIKVSQLTKPFIAPN